MPFVEPSFTVGIEEEYLLVDRKTRDLVRDPSEDIMRDCEDALGELVRPEFLRSQIEVGTAVCATITEAGQDLKRLRARVAEIADRHGYAIIAASTHPFAQWMRQKHTDKDRYRSLAERMQTVARRLVICGMHVHVGIDDAELRVDLMKQAAYFLPHLLALSTSSPFWRGQPTGLKSYRISVFDELPRTGLPPKFDSEAEYLRHCEMLTKAGVIEDASMLWWDIRPSFRFPTLEMRITDVCPRCDDAVSIAAIYISLLRMLYRLARSNQRWRVYKNMLVSENRWRAQRYGLDEGLIDIGQRQVFPMTDLLEEIIDLVDEDAEALGCLDNVLHSRTIIERGTSAHRQLATFESSVAAGATEREALRQVVDQLIDETVADI